MAIGIYAADATGVTRIVGQAMGPAPPHGGKVSGVCFGVGMGECWVRAAAIAAVATFACFIYESGQH